MERGGDQVDGDEDIADEDRDEDGDEDCDDDRDENGDENKEVYMTWSLLLYNSGSNLGPFLKVVVSPKFFFYKFIYIMGR